MLSSQDRENLDSLSRLLLARFEAELADEAYDVEFTDCLRVTVSPRHPEVAGLFVDAADGEVTVWFGELFHEHFSSLYYTHLPKAEAEARSVEHAMELVRCILQDDVILRVTYEGATPRAASIRLAGQEDATSGVATFRDPDGGGMDEARTVSYVWSGPLSKG